MSNYKLNKKRKLHDEYLLSSKNFVISQQNETPRTQRKRKASNFSNPSCRKSTIKSTKKVKLDFGFPKNFPKNFNHRKLRQRINISSDKTKRLELTKIHKDSPYLSATRIQNEQKKDRKKHSRVFSQIGKSLDLLYDRCEKVLKSYQKKFNCMKKQNEKLKDENKKLKQHS